MRLPGEGFNTLAGRAGAALHFPGATSSLLGAPMKSTLACSARSAPVAPTRIQPRLRPLGLAGLLP